MTKLELAKMGMEFSKNCYTKYHAYRTKVYKYRGEYKERRELYMTAEGIAIMNILADENNAVFVCPHCGQRCTFHALEFWTGEDTLEELMADQVICSECYEDEMGDDL